MAIVGMNGREIAYRAWDKERGVMREVKEISWVTGSITVEPIKGTSEWWDMYDPILFEGMYELMQYTDLMDKNGVRICEGDIIRTCLSDIKGETRWGRIVMKNPFEYSVEEALYINHADELEILGNIYDNSELLKECE